MVSNVFYFQLIFTKKRIMKIHFKSFKMKAIGIFGCYVKKSISVNVEVN